MNFDTFLDQAWEQHADDPAGVAARIDDTGTGMVRDESQLLALAHLAHHVHGEHLAAWQAGRALLQRLAALPCAPKAGAGADQLRRYLQALAVCEEAGGDTGHTGHTSAWRSLSGGDRIAVAALAAANLVLHDTPRAAALLQQALSEADAAALPAGDPAARALAGGSNNLASTLETLERRTPAQRALMITAAEAARRWWAVAGTWLHVERAEYRLAGVWLAAGDPARAQTHAQACLDIVQAEGHVPLELFHAWDALGRVARAAGDEVGSRVAVGGAEGAFASLEEGDRPYCLKVLERMRGG